MNRAIELAKNAIRSAYPNPAVGCVIVHQNKIIGEGYTSPYGGPHAEVNAIASVSDPSLLSSAELYVTLEPCSHFGKTPPCANLIVEHKIPEVYIGLKDPNPSVAGRGIALLQDYNTKVTQGILESACREHHKKFLCYQENKRPYIVLKWAETIDGFIAPDKEKRNLNPQPYWISSPASKTRVHLWRSQEQAILIGVNTLKEDNPSLNVRLVKGMNPTPIIIDPHFKIDKEDQLYNNPNTIVFTNKSNSLKTTDYPFRIEQIDFTSNTLDQVLSKLHQLQIMSVFVEGGAYTLKEFITSNLWDEARIIQSPNSFKSGIEAPKLPIDPIKKESLEVDSLFYYQNKSDG